MSGMRQGEHTGAVLEDLHLTGDGTGWYEVSWKLEALDREHGCQDKTGQVTCHLKRAAYCPQARWIKPDGFEGRHVEGAWWLTRPKHDDPGTVRAVPLSAAEVTAISRWLEATAHYDRRHGLIWCNEDGSPVTPAQDNKELRALFAEAGVPAGLTGHVLRHSFVTIAAAQPGADINVIAKISGHPARVAEGIYRHHTQEERRRAVAALAEAITKPEGTGGRTNPHRGEYEKHRTRIQFGWSRRARRDKVGASRSRERYHQRSRGSAGERAEQREWSSRSRPGHTFPSCLPRRESWCDLLVRRAGCKLTRDPA